LKLNLALSTVFGNSDPSTPSPRAPNAIKAARRALTILVFLSQGRTFPLGLDGTREHQTPFAEDVNGQRRSSTINRKDVGKRIFGDRNLVRLKCDIAAEIYDLRHYPRLSFRLVSGQSLIGSGVARVCRKLSG
jgi:hypothetical protein